MPNHPHRSKRKKASPMFQDLDHEAHIQQIERDGMNARRRGDPHLTNPHYRGSDEDARAWTRGYDREMRANAGAAKAAKVEDFATNFAQTLGTWLAAPRREAEDDE